MPKKGGKGKKKKEDEWGSIPRETFTTVAVRNSQWHHMQFDLVLPTSTRFGAVVEEIVARHELGGAAGQIHARRAVGRRRRRRQRHLRRRPST